MPSYYRRKLVKVGNSYYVCIPPSWIKAKIREGKLKPEKETKHKKREAYFLDIIINDKIMIELPREVKISIQK